MSSVVVFDYGSGNIHSAMRALHTAGASPILTCDPRTALRADGLVVPGVGAFAACMTALKAVGGDEIIQERVTAGRPLLGICVGHQILFSSGVEHGINTEGVGIYPGSVQALPTTRVPHMGWNQVVPEPGSQFLTRTQMFYFVHSYAAMNRDDLDDEAVVMWANHEGVDLIAAVEYGPVLSTQFHPEKSAQPGLALIRRWVDHLGVS